MLKRIINRLRLKWFITSHSLGYAADFFERTYKIYLNYAKVLHYRDGYPVYSLSTPALFSKPSINMFARMIFGKIQNRNIPNLLSFAVSGECNANCSFCSFFSATEKKSQTILSKEECREVIRQSQELGVSVINFVGGEPLSREDFLSILAFVDKDVSTTTMFTNGLLLAPMAVKLKKAGLDGVYVSLDSPNENEHDNGRGTPGLYRKALSGITAAKKAGLSVGLSACLWEEGYRRGLAAELIEFGKKIGVHEVLFFDATPTGRLKDHKELMDNGAWVEEFIESTKKYNENQDYPGVLVYAYSTSFRSTGCAGGTSYFYVSPYGEISPCDFNHYVFGNIREERLYKIWDRIQCTDGFGRAFWGGCKLKNSEFRNASQYIKTE